MTSPNKSRRVPRATSTLASSIVSLAVAGSMTVHILAPTTGTYAEPEPTKVSAHDTLLPYQAPLAITAKGNRSTQVN